MKKTSFDKNQQNEDYRLWKNMALQLRMAIDSTGKFKVSEKIKRKEINKILIQGMGGSGITGFILQSMLKTKLKIPVIVNQSDEIPEFVDRKTLFITISYSGNTIETLKALGQAKKRKAVIFCVTSGGKMKKMHDRIVLLEKGFPPRTQLMQIIAATLTILDKTGIIKTSKRLETIHSFLKKNISRIEKQSKMLANKISGKFIVIYCDENIGSVAKRFQQQLNENSKVFAHYAFFPEVNHNEIEAARFPCSKNKIAFVVIRHAGESKETNKIINLAEKILKTKGRITEVKTNQKDFVREIVELVALLDFTTYWLAKKYKEDPVELKFIPKIKKWLAK